MMDSVMLGQGQQTSFTHQTPGAPRCFQERLHFHASSPESVQKGRFRCLTNRAPPHRVPSFPLAPGGAFPPWFQCRTAAASP